MDPNLVDGRLRARRFMHKYSHHFPDDATTESLVKDRTEMLGSILGRMGEDIYIEPPFSIDYGCNISIGDKFYANFKWV
jgi:acetyltransferase-like isoleucine patch superfamily enzyme